MSVLLRRLGAWLLRAADRLECSRCHEIESLVDASASRARIFHLRTRIHCGYY
jgi:hypothetical protein